MGITDAKTAWDTLKEIHQFSDRTRLKGLLAEFMKFRLDTTIDEAASKLNRLQTEIGTLDTISRPSDAIKTEALLGSLGPEYEATLAGIDASGTASFEEVVSRLRRAEIRLNGLSEDLQGQNLARLTQGKVPSKNIRKKGACFRCGKPGHYQRECKEPLTERSVTDRTTNIGDSQRNRGDITRGYQAAATGEPQTHERAWKASYDEETVKGQDLWYLDSAATSYMTEDSYRSQESV